MSPLITNKPSEGDTNALTGAYLLSVVGLLAAAIGIYFAFKLIALNARHCEVVNLDVRSTIRNAEKEHTQAIAAEKLRTDDIEKQVRRHKDSVELDIAKHGMDKSLSDMSDQIKSVNSKIDSVHAELTSKLEKILDRLPSKTPGAKDV